MFRLRSCAVLLATCVAAATQAQTGGLIDGELGRWINSTAGPALLETLDRHPRFRGETLRVVAMDRGKPLHTADRLSLALQRTLEDTLVRSNGVRVAVSTSVSRCGAAPDIPYLLGIEIERDGPTRHQVRLAVTDVEEGIWVNGASQTWSGRLTTTQRRALLDRNHASPGAFGQPLPLRDSAAVAAALEEQLNCEIHTVPSTNVVLVANGPELNEIRRQLSHRLRDSAHLRSVQADADDAWQLKVRSAGTGTYREVILDLEDPSGEHPVQRLASVDVSGAAALPPSLATSSAPNTIGDTIGSPDEGRTSQHSDSLWLSELTFAKVAPNGLCRRNSGADCIEVSIEAFQPLYVAVFHTRDGKVDVPACGRRTKRQDGERRFRFELSDAAGSIHSEAAVDAGFYAIATDDTRVARALTRQLAAAPGACRGANGDLDAWLQALDRLLTEHDHALQWRALHLNRDQPGPVAL